MRLRGVRDIISSTNFWFWNNYKKKKDQTHRQESSIISLNKKDLLDRVWRMSIEDGNSHIFPWMKIKIKIRHNQHRNTIFMLA